MNDKLLNCPFCGGEFEEPINTASKQGDTWLWSTECMGCGLFIDDKDKENLIKRVNTRKPLERIVEQLEKESDFFGGEPMGSLQKAYYCKGIEKAIEIVKGGVDNAG